MAGGGIVRVKRLDHLVLTVRDVGGTCDFYRRALGMRETVFDGDKEALAFGEQKINLHEAGNEFRPKAKRPTPGSADLCFVADLDAAAVAEHLRSCGVEIVHGPVGQTGALGRMASVYFRDPDRNLVEVSCYGPDVGGHAEER